ncbi:MAG: YchJ family protein [Gammaproteobacteria bacterium]|nr:YchJ family protein [Gammaproteobacteria bacterium]
MNNNRLCPCGSGFDYAGCCGAFHTGEAQSATAEALMRSRFTAYVMDNMAYIQRTWDSSTRPSEEKLNFGGEEIVWQKLALINAKKGQADDQKGVVEFKAYYLKDGVEHVLHEVSRFIKTNNRWFYVDGVVKAASQVVMPKNEGKNAPCSCGSGKKYKRCCGA